MTTATATAQALKEWDQELLDLVSTLGMDTYEGYKKSYYKVKDRIAPKLRVDIAQKHGIDKTPLKNWLNARALRDEDGGWLGDEDGQAILDQILADHSPATAPTDSPTEPAATPATPKPAKPSLLDDLLSSDEAKELMAGMMVSPDQFVLLAVHAYLNSAKGPDLSSIPTADLMGSRKDGHGVELVQRAVKFLMGWNGKQGCDDLRYQITYPILKALTKTATATIEQVLGNPTKGIVGSLETEISEHHAMMGMTSKVYNRGKKPVTDLIQAGRDF